jgi:hypothetical protein
MTNRLTPFFLQEIKMMSQKKTILIGREKKSHPVICQLKKIQGTTYVVLVIDEMTKRNVGLNCKNQSREGCDLVVHVESFM